MQKLSSHLVEIAENFMASSRLVRGAWVMHKRKNIFTTELAITKTNGKLMEEELRAHINEIIRLVQDVKVATIVIETSVEVK